MALTHQILLNRPQVAHRRDRLRDIDSIHSILDERCLPSFAAGNR